MTKAEYKKILEEDQVANCMANRKFPRPFYDYNWIYLRIMRKIEYLSDKKGLITKVLLAVLKFRFRQYSVKTGISIPPNTFGGGLTLYHYGSIIVNENVKGGKFVTIQSATNISGNVSIGNNVYLAPGAKVLDNVKILEGVIVGANSVVTRNILEPYTSWAGVPARKISDKGYINRLDKSEL